MLYIPVIPMGRRIPRIIHQAFPTKNLPAEMRELVDKLCRENPTWEHRLYDHGDIDKFIEIHFGQDMLRQFHRIDKRYGAARIDFWRYLAIYKMGGVYIDIKSTFTCPLDNIITDNDQFILSSWDQSPDSEFAGYGLHKQLSHLSSGEFQQWHVIAVEGHPFLRAVVERVLANINSYNPWRDGTGKIAVLNVTGPVPYTLAIEPLLKDYPHRIVENEQSLSLVYNALGGVTYQSFLPSHYSLQNMPLIKQSIPVQLFYLCYLYIKEIYVALRTLKRRMLA